jgi:hypothetical protein
LLHFHKHHCKDKDVYIFGKVFYEAM